MDFGSILDKWEKQGSQNAGTRAGVRSDDINNQLDSWLFVNGIYDKDLESTENKNTGHERRRLRNKKPEAELDIHGQTRDEANLSLETFFDESRKNGLKKILIIHGKGNHSTGEAVLKRVVMDFIEKCSYAGESGRGKAASGGEGATWVLLKDIEKNNA